MKVIERTSSQKAAKKEFQASMLLKSSKGIFLLPKDRRDSRKREKNTPHKLRRDAKNTPLTREKWEKKTLQDHFPPAREVVSVILKRDFESFQIPFQISISLVFRIQRFFF